VKRHLLTTLSLSLLAAFAHAADTAPAGTPTALVAGINVQQLNKAVRPQDDMFAHVNSNWLQTTDIPADRSSWGTFAILRDGVQPQIRAIIESAQADKSTKAGSSQQKIGDMYASFMDDKRADALGYKPLAGDLAKIRTLKDRKQIPALVAHLSAMGVATPHEAGIMQDARESTRYAVYIGQGGLGLPDRDYYLKNDDAKLVDTRAKYEQHVATMLGMTGHKDAAAAAKAILAFETELARVQWSNVALRDIPKQYNKVDVAKLNAVTPGYDWSGFLKTAGIDGKVGYVIAMQPDYLAAYAALVGKTELSTLKSYFEWQLVRAYAPYLSKPFVDANFAFYGTTITGVTANRPRWKLGVDAVEEALGEAVGQQYVARHFPAERKARMETLVANLLAAFKQSITDIDWMGAETKKQAQGKLATFMPKIGYPDKWRNYSALTVKRDDLVGNIKRSRAFKSQTEVAKLGKPIDRAEWGMTPQTVNAYYNPLLNEIVFPASILQPPFFDMNADDAANYGGIGAVIGHEIGHGFDDQGSGFDGDGNLRDWWTDADRAGFKQRTAMLVKQYGAYTPLPGYSVNGELTLGENIGDNSGLAIAYKAYKLSLGGKPAPVINGLTGDQRFFMGWAQVWRVKMREQAQIVQVKTDPHSPGQYRANGTLMNQPAFYEAFGVKEGDKMYLPPKDRVSIW
jgi:putative endopeptidase